VLEGATVLGSGLVIVKAGGAGHRAAAAAEEAAEEAEKARLRLRL
jgi:hypothetical protein